MGSEHSYNFREQLITVIGQVRYFSGQGNRDSEQGVNYTVST